MAEPQRSTRARETRAAEARVSAQDYTPPATMALPTARRGYHLRWIREIDAGGQLDRENLYKRQKEGYRPVKAGDYPDWALGVTSPDEPIRRGKSLLMEIPLERKLARDEHYRNQARRQVETVDRQQGMSMRPRGGIIPASGAAAGEESAEVIIGGRVRPGAPE